MDALYLILQATAASRGGQAGVPSGLEPAEGCVHGFGVIHDCRNKETSLK